MDIVLQKMLKQKYPKTYGIWFKGMHHGFHAIEGWGIECGSGWYHILDRLSAVVEEEINKLPEDKQPDMHVVQVKEKFGGLRFYMSSGNKVIWDAVGKAEKESFETCEKCGEKGRLWATEPWHWLYTSCDCHKRNKEDVEYTFEEDEHLEVDVLIKSEE